MQSLFFLAPTRRFIALGSLLGLSLALTGCPGASSPNCTDIAFASLNVAVASADDSVPTGVSVRYSVDGGDMEDCDGADGDWTCGWETAGEFIVEVTANDHELQTHALTIGEDECHIIPQQLSVVLEPIECTEELVYGVQLNLVDGVGATLEPGSGAWASWGFANADMAAQPCDVGPAGSWSCGLEESGPFEIFAGRIGDLADAAYADVAFDGCHPVTEEALIQLFPATTQCTENIVSSAYITVLDSVGAPISGATVEFNSAWVPWFAPEPCGELAPGEYVCGNEFAGVMEVSISAEDYGTVIEEIFVLSDECHVISETREVILEDLSG